MRALSFVGSSGSADPGGKSATWAVSSLFLVAVTGAVLKALGVSFAILGVAGILGGIAASLWILLTFGVTCLLHSRIRSAVQLVIALGLCVVLYADVLHVRAFGSLLNAGAVASLSTFGDMAPSVMAVMRPVDVLFLADLFLMTGLMAAKRRPSAIGFQAPRRGIVLMSTPVLLGFFVLTAFQVSRAPISQETRMVVAGPVAVHLNQLYMAFLAGGESLKREEVELIDSWMASNSEFLAPSGEHSDLAGILAGKDIYLVIVESMEQVVLGLEVEGQEVAPGFSRLRNESLVFSGIIQQTRDGNTSDAELMILAGMYPLDSGSAFLRFPNNQFGFTLPEALSERGYRPIALHGDAASFWNRDVVYPKLGFADYVSEEDFAHAPQVGLGVLDGALFDQALLEKGKTSEPSFMMLSTVTSHIPWSLPDELQGLRLSKDDATARYIQTINYVDGEFTEFYESLGREGALQDSAFIIVGDHEGIHKYHGDETWLPPNDGMLPFMVHVPGMEGRIVDVAGGQVDILPTLTYLLGIPPGEVEGRVMGRNLLGEGTGSAVDSGGLVRDNATGADLLAEAFHVSDLALRGDYFRPAGP